MTDTSNVAGTIQLDIPSNIGIKNGIIRDTIKLDIEKKYIDQILSGKASFEIVNDIPTFLKTSVLLLDGYGTLLRAIPSKPLIIASAQTDADGFVFSSTQTNTSVLLDHDQLQAIVNAESVVLITELDTPPSSPSVIFRNSDYVQFRITSTLNYRVDFDRLK
jgi:hypothetical protein